MSEQENRTTNGEIWSVDLDNEIQIETADFCDYAYVSKADLKKMLAAIEGKEDANQDTI